jgi:hypothetical protein
MEDCMPHGDITVIDLELTSHKTEFKSNGRLSFRFFPILQQDVG